MAVGTRSGSPPVGRSASGTRSVGRVRTSFPGRTSPRRSKSSIELPSVRSLSSSRPSGWPPSGRATVSCRLAVPRAGVADVEAHAKPVFLRAVAFAVAKHGAVQQARKGTSFPYVVHPLRVGETLDRFGETEDVVVAGLLHDVTEDAGVTQHELSLEFGPRVAELVRKASELDPTLPWQERKERTVERVRAETDREALAVVAADKLDN